MRQNSYKNLPRLNNYNYENIFNVYTDESDKYFYNLLQTIEVPKNLPPGFYDSYDTTPGDTWPYISFKVYENPSLWWLITSINDIVDPTKQIEPATTLKILKTRYASLMISQIATQAN